MDRQVRIRAVERKEIDLDRLAFVLLRFARERLAERDPATRAPKLPEPQDE